jgi:hypothetical protein
MANGLAEKKAMNKLQIIRDLYGLELVLDSVDSTYEINLWFTDGVKVRIAHWKWDESANNMCLVFVGNSPFRDLVNRDIFWQLAEYGQSELDEFFWDADNAYA